MKPCHRCGGATRPSTKADEAFPGDASRYPLACDRCMILIAAADVGDWQSHPAPPTEEN